MPTAPKKDVLWRLHRGMGDAARVRGTSAWGARMRRIRGARAAHAAIRAQGRIPCAEATAARLRYARERAERAQLGAPRSDTIPT